MQSVTFNVSVITNGETSIKTRKGVANGVVEESTTEADLLLTNVQAGTMLTDVALFVDSDSQALGGQAQTKYWRHGWGGGWYVPCNGSESMPIAAQHLFRPCLTLDWPDVSRLHQVPHGELQEDFPGTLHT